MNENSKYKNQKIHKMLILTHIWRLMENPTISEMEKKK